MELKIDVTEEVNEAMLKLKNKECKWVIMKSDDKKEKCELELVGDLGSDYEAFKEAFPTDQPR